MNSNRIKTRIAPSPTGNLHVGTVHTALFNFLFARHHGGEFIMRIEDTDLERSDKKFESDISEGLQWLGISWDGVITRQSERLTIYQQYLEKLLQEQKAFYCPHTIEELETEKKEQMVARQTPCHRCSARDQNLKEGIIRLRNEGTEPIAFEDHIRGTLSFDPTSLGDISVAKDTKTPLYNFAVVVDDSDMEITHVIRGEDHISNTPKQMLISQALGFAQPQYAHISLLLGTDRSKLSKRHGATAIADYRAQGYLPEAMVNFLALLGWNPGTEQEVFSMEELVREFSLERVQKSGAVFDLVKLDWMNGEYIRKKLPRELRELASVHLGDLTQHTDSETLEKILVLEQPRLKKFAELPEKVDYFFKEPEYDASLLMWKSMNSDALQKSLLHTKKIVENFSETDWSKENIETVFLKEAETYQNRGELLWPLRVALSGKKASPGPFDLLAILGKQKSLARLTVAIDKTKNNRFYYENSLCEN